MAKGLGLTTATRGYILVDTTLKCGITNTYCAALMAHIVVPHVLCLYCLLACVLCTSNVLFTSFRIVYLLVFCLLVGVLFTCSCYVYLLVFCLLVCVLFTCFVL